MSALLFMFAYLQFGAQGQWLSAACVIVAGAALIVTFFVDLRHYIILDELVWIVFGVGVVWDIGRLAQGVQGWGWITFQESAGSMALTVFLPRSLVGAAVGAGAFMAIGWFFTRLFGKESLGGGDVKLAAGVGALFGPGYTFAVWFLLAVFAGAAVGVALWIVRARKRGEYIPFGPFLALSAIVMMLWGNELTTVFIVQFYTPFLR